MIQSADMSEAAACAGQGQGRGLVEIGEHEQLDLRTVSARGCQSWLGRHGVGGGGWFCSQRLHFGTTRRCRAVFGCCGVAKPHNRILLEFGVGVDRGEEDFQRSRDRMAGEKYGAAVAVVVGGV
jgi:hypothetical protein